MASEKKKRNNQNTFWHWIWIATLVAAAVVGYLALDGDGACCADPENTAQVALGAELYVTHCAECHEANLEEDWDWQTPLGDGGLRAPPHDESGHTWHHTDDYLFAYTKTVAKGWFPPSSKATCRVLRRNYPMRISGRCCPISRAAGRAISFSVRNN